jgi:hypothetical protein
MQINFHTCCYVTYKKTPQLYHFPWYSSNFAPLHNSKGPYGWASLTGKPAYTPEVLFIFGCCDVIHKIIFIVDVVVCHKL